MEMTRRIAIDRRVLLLHQLPFQRSACSKSERMDCGSRRTHDMGRDPGAPFRWTPSRHSAIADARLKSSGPPSGAQRCRPGSRSLAAGAGGSHGRNSSGKALRACRCRSTFALPLRYVEAKRPTRRSVPAMCNIAPACRPPGGPAWALYSQPLPSDPLGVGGAPVAHDLALGRQSLRLGQVAGNLVMGPSAANAHPARPGHPVNVPHTRDRIRPQLTRFKIPIGAGP
jgi:hypothetical protein